MNLRVHATRPAIVAVLCGTEAALRRLDGARITVQEEDVARRQVSLGTAA